MEVWGKERYATDALHRYGCHKCHSYSHLSRSDFTTPPLHLPGVDFYDALSLTKLPENSWFSHAEIFSCDAINYSSGIIFSRDESSRWWSANTSAFRTWKSSDIYTVPIQVEEGLGTTNQRWIGWLWTKIFSSRKTYSQGFLPLARLVSLPGWKILLILAGYHNAPLFPSRCLLYG